MGKRGIIDPTVEKRMVLVEVLRNGVKYLEASSAEAEVVRLRTALDAIVSLDPGSDSVEGYNEWGEADCFYKAQALAREALHGN